MGEFNLVPLHLKQMTSQKNTAFATDNINHLYFKYYFFTCWLFHGCKAAEVSRVKKFDNNSSCNHKSITWYECVGGVS